MGTYWFPWTFPIAITALITFLVISRWGFWRKAIWLGWVLLTLGGALTTLFSRTISDASWICIAITTGTGIGILYPSLHLFLQTLDVPEEDGLRKTVTSFTFFQLLGNTFGLSISASIFQNELLRNFSSNPVFAEHASKYAKDAVALIIRVRAAKMSGEKTQLFDAYVDSLRMVWVVMAASAGLALFASCFIKNNQQSGTRGTEMDEALNDRHVV